MRYSGPKNRLARREGADLGLKTVGSKAHSSLLRKIAIPPGQHGTSRVRKKTEYGSQLREKQKVKRTYGLTEKAMRRLFDEAKRRAGNTSDNLVQLLEGRLDNTIYRLGWAPTRASARQLTTHAHFLMNDKKHNIPSTQMKVGDKITLKKESTASLPVVMESVKREVMIPSWLKSAKWKAEIVDVPKILDSDINWQYVIEFYSR